MAETLSIQLSIHPPGRVHPWVGGQEGQPRPRATTRQPGGVLTPETKLRRRTAEELTGDGHVKFSAPAISHF